LKLKYFLRGLGVGIVLTSIILCVFYRNHTPEQNVVEQAKELGMVFPEGTAEPFSASGEAAEVQSATEEPTEDEFLTEEPVTEEPVTEEPTEDSSVTEKPTADSSVTEKPTAAKDSASKKKGTKFTVRSGLLSSSVAKEMMEAGIIKNDKALDDYLEKNGYATEVREGTYFIPEGASYKEIAKIITGK
jgi:hypothetical protein